MADSSAATFGADDYPGFEQGVAGIPVAVLRPAQLAYQRGIPDSGAVRGNQCLVTKCGEFFRASDDLIADSACLRAPEG